LDCSEPERVIEVFAHGARGVFCMSEGFGPSVSHL
jgi:hypothetical protein